LCVALGAAGTAFAAGGFGRPFTIERPVANDLIPAQLAFAPGNAVAAAFGIQNEDNNADSSGELALARPGGGFGSPRAISNAQQVLALAYRGTQLEILTGNSPSGQECCSAVLASPVTGGRVGARQTIVSGQIGAAVAQLVPVGKRLLAAVASEHGVWVSQTNDKGHFGAVRSLNVKHGWPQLLAATALTGNKTIVVWTALTSQFASGPSGIYLAAGGGTGLPSHPHITLSVPSGHEIDELQLIGRGSAPTVAWIESWYDAAGHFHSQAYAEDLAGTRSEQTLSSPPALASGLSLAAGADGTEAATFRTCTTAGACEVHAVVRRPGHRFGGASAIGPTDAAQTPVVAVGAKGAVVASWVANGSVVAATAAPGAGRLGPPVTVSGTMFASNLALGFAPSGTLGLLAWTQGTENQSILAAHYNAG
jgi:hypothetical protein